MSGICGIVRFDGGPVPREQLSAMQEAMAGWGPHGMDTYSEDGIAVTRFLQRQTPEDLNDTQPMHAGPQVMVASARLDNREELLRALEVAPAERASTADAALLLAAFERWGEGMPEHIAGDWHAAVWDRRSRKLFLARDHFGFTCLYYFQHAEYFAFASSIKALLALPGVTFRPDLTRVAQVLVAWVGSGDRSAYEGIHPLPAGHTLTLAGRHVETRRYWDPAALPPLPPASDEEYIEQFLSVYEEAVRGCLRGEAQVGATLSGGLDSGSVVALAGPMLRNAGRGLTAYTSVPLFESATGAGTQRTGNEWNDAHATAEMAGVTTHHAVDAAGVSLLEGVAAYVETHDTPGHAVGNYYWMHEIFRRASAEGIGILLCGQYGNASISYSGSGALWPLMARGDWRGVAQSLALTEPSYALAVKRQVIKPLLYYPASWYAVRGPGSWGRRMSQCAINPAFVDSLGLRDMLAQATDDIAALPRVGIVSQHTFYAPGMGVAGGIWRKLAASRGICVRDPTANRRLIEFCVQAPDHLFRRQGIHRWLIRRAMADRMPPQVLHYKKKGLQAVDAGYRAREAREEFRAALDRFARHDLARHCLDLGRMRGLLDSLEQGVTQANTLEVISILCRGTGAGLFLGRF